MKSFSPIMLAVAFGWGVSVMTASAADAADQQTVDLKVGDAAPAFEAKTDEGKAWKSADFAKKTLVVYFYPAAMTGGCTKQACAYRDDREKLADQGVEVVAVSGDQPAGLALFKKAEKLNFTLLSDPDGAVAKKFGVPVGDGGKIEKEIDGQKHTLERGVSAKRWTFVIKKGKVAYKNTAVDAAGDSKAILTFLEKQAKE